MKIERLIGIITILLQKEQVTAPELAKRFEVSRRTINRDIEDICKAGIPVVTSQGYNGGISIADGYKIDKSLFTKDELQTILAGVQSIDSIAGFTNVQNILDKLATQSSAQKGDNVILDDFLVINVGSYYENTLAQKVEIIKGAIRAHKLITFSYYYNKGDCIRTIEPYHIVFQWASWYVFGFCTEKLGFRLFKLNRLWNLSETDTRFTPRNIPEEEQTYRTGWFKDKFKLMAQFDPSVKYRLIESYGVDCFTVCADGKLQFELTYENYNNMLEWMQSFGDKVTILEPQDLIIDIKKQAENVIKMYNRQEQ